MSVSTADPRIMDGVQRGRKVEHSSG